MNEGVLSWERNVINPDRGLDEYFTVVIELVKSLLNLVQGVSTYCIVLDQIAEVKEGGKTSDYITRHMSSDSGKIDLKVESWYHHK